jgi:hypothetical protein
MENAVEDLPIAIFPFLKCPSVIMPLTSLISHLIVDGYLTETLRDRLLPSLLQFQKAVKKVTPEHEDSNNEKSPFQTYENCLTNLSLYILKNDTGEFEYDLESMKSISEATKPKRQNKASLYVKVLNGVANKAGMCTNVEKYVFKNGPYAKKVFGGGPALAKFLMLESSWLLG